jgi:hypothetical protein
LETAWIAVIASLGGVLLGGMINSLAMRSGGDARIVKRNANRLPGEGKPLLSDIYDATRRNLVEAKGTGTRQAVRMAIGQLADYERFTPPDTARAVLLPDRPRADLEELLSSEGIACVWVTDTGFSDNAGGRFSQA